MKDEKEYSNEREYFPIKIPCGIGQCSTLQYCTFQNFTCTVLFIYNIVCLSNILQKFILSWNTTIEQYSGIFTTEEKVFHSTVL